MFARLSARVFSPSVRRSKKGRGMMPLLIAALAETLFLSACGSSIDHPPAQPASPTVAQLTATCAALTGQVLAGVTVTSATRIEAITNVTTAGICKVSGTRAPYLDIEVDVPDNWSGRYWQNGGGGFDGTIPTAFTITNNSITAVSPPLAKWAAVYAASNGGNRASIPSEAAPAVWATGTSDAQLSATDYAYQSVGTTLGFAKAVINAFYKTPATHRYFNGCSNGGREGYIAAQRWPNDFDGVVAGCETEDMATQTAFWLTIGQRNATNTGLTTAQYQGAYAKAVAACDTEDGAADNYLANPAACKFDPAQLQCGLSSASTDPSVCLSAAQVQTLKTYQSTLTLSDGTVLYAGMNWSDYSAFGSQYGLLGGGFALIATGDPSWLTTARQATFDVNTDYPALQAGLQSTSADHDLSAIAKFVASGKKLISWHDLGDNLLSPNDHARNDAKLTALIKNMGIADPTTGTRLFMVPANSHGLGANLALPNSVDWTSAIIAWVEQGTAPTQLTYTFTTSASTQRSLPVCLYPKAPHYSGGGDVNAAASWSCV
ncbi:tannase/feruloyl esterase family alpha/beta hydrolase (plasmid) [Paraburkholderia sp. PREW-6R]|uniref:tannase/feruloyl esterase family alpha/beta hydrolase n=1 Tax=Paraburkholderia sp. PREW-6R TaxID=3141544 RepID=UPI0031F4CEC7